MKEMMMLEQLMIENKDVLIRLKEGNPEDYTVEAIKERETLQKNIEKEGRKKRRTWQGYFTRKTPTKKEKEEKNRKKYHKGIDKDD